MNGTITIHHRLIVEGYLIIIVTLISLIFHSLDKFTAGAK